MIPYKINGSFICERCRQICKGGCFEKLMAIENGEVTVYAKLPNGFKIPTPLGNYNPDWAIVLDNKDFKYVYFS